MSSSLLDPVLAGYLQTHNRPEHPVLRKCREETANLAEARMQISPEQGSFHAFLLELLSAKRAVEVGVFTGYSALTAALTLQKRDGYLLGCDLSEEWTSCARAYLREANVDSLVELVVAPATETLSKRLQSGEAASYDFAFIDADKSNYGEYYELCLALLRPGGLMVADNMLWSGRVADPSDTTEDTRTLRALAARAMGDQRVDASLIAVGDGLLLCRKR